MLRTKSTFGMARRRTTCLFIHGVEWTNFRTNTKHDHHHTINSEYDCGDYYICGDGRHLLDCHRVRGDQLDTQILQTTTILEEEQLFLLFLSLDVFSFGRSVVLIVCTIF